MTRKDEMADGRLMSDEAVEDAVLRYLEESRELVNGLAPPRDLWPGIEARIGARVRPLGREPVEVRRVRRRPAWLAVAAAAMFLVASTAGVTYVLTKQLVPPGSAVASSTRVVTTPARVAPTPSVAPDVPAQVASAGVPSDHDVRNAASSTERTPRVATESEETHGTPRTTLRAPATTLARYPMTGSDEARVTYDDEIARLHGVLDSRRDQLDPATVATVEQNLHIIDNAIRQARAALVGDPHSRLLNEELDRTLAKKTELLRAATLLPSA